MIDHTNPNPTIPARVVIAGGSGFVGSNLVAHLDALGVETVPLSSAELDLRQPDSVAMLQHTVGADDALVIVSALTPDRGRDIGTLMQNLAMGGHLANFLELGACSHVIYVSSDAVYGESENPVCESSICNPPDLYGTMHLTRERMLAFSAKNAGIPFLILRPSLLYGPDDPHNSYGPNRFFRTARGDGNITLFGNGEEKRDHIYVEDMSRLLGLCLAHRSEGVLNVATGSSTSFFDIAQIISNMCGDGVQIEPLPREVPITYRHYDITETLKAFPAFRYTPLRSGLVETFTRTTEAA